MYDVQEERRDFPVTKNHVYFNHAAVGPMSLSVKRVLDEINEDLTYNGIVHAASWRGQVAKVREMAAQLIGAETEEIAFINKTGQGLSFIANGLPWERGDNMIIADIEYPSNVYPWWNLKDRGVEVKSLPMRAKKWVYASDYEELIDERTRVIAVSSVQFATGFRHDLEALGKLCRKHGIYFVVDAIQSLGVIPMDVKKFQIDALCAGGFKWMVSPFGSGILYVSNRILEDLKVADVGAHSVVNADDYLNYDFTFAPGAARFEHSGVVAPSVVAMGASISRFLRLGVGQIEGHVLHLVRLLIDNLREKGYTVRSSDQEEERSGILLFEKPGGDQKAIYDKLTAAGVACAFRDGATRLSPHFYNTEEEVERILDLL